ncbi:MAG: MFS transporter [Chloroflexota bacterium]
MSRWIILTLCVLSVVFVYTVPTVMLPVLFAEMAAELDLDIVQLGVAWGSIALSSMIVGLFGGALGDRFGSKLTLGIICLLMGIFGILRGFAPNYPILIVTFMLFGLVSPSLPPNLHKAAAYHFPNNRGISTVIISLGFAFALFISSRYTATVISPLVGGWRQVLFWFGGFGLVFGLIWLLLVPNGTLPPPAKGNQPFFSGIFASLKKVLAIREMWIIGIASTLFWACFRGFTGYTPLYLRNLGWTAVEADNTLSTFFLASLILALPATLISERLGSRKPFLAGSMVLIGGGVLALGFVGGGLILVAVFVAGLMFDGYMALHQAEVLDLKDIGPFAGTALGSLVMFREAGGVFGPPIGNWLVQFGPTTPFIFWGGLGLMAAVILLFLGTKKEA